MPRAGQPGLSRTISQIWTLPGRLISKSRVEILVATDVRLGIKIHSRLWVSGSLQCKKVWYQHQLFCVIGLAS